MIAHLDGILLKKTTESMIIDNQGIGYEVFAPLSTFYALPDEAEKVSLHIYTHIREDAIILFGFQTTLEKKIFCLLISVTGIGPKLAINILSGIGPNELLEAIAQGDSICLQSIPGVGKKTAERIALELKDKAQNVREDLALPPTITTRSEDKRIFDDALSALLNLGYPMKLAKPAVEKTMSGLKAPGLEDLIKESLKLLV